MHTTSVINDRVFWIYAIVILLSIILGLNFILISNMSIVIALLWIISQVSLLITIYYIADKVDCDYINNHACIVANIIFLFILIAELIFISNSVGILGILIILAGLTLFWLYSENTFMIGHRYIVFWASITFIITWILMTFYIIHNN